MGMEESYGCLVGTHARDKDGPAAVMCTLRGCSILQRARDSHLWDHMVDLYEKYGYYKEGLLHINAQRVLAGAREDPQDHDGSSQS